MASRRLRFHPSAEAELQDAASWYEERSPGLGLRFVSAVRHLRRRPGYWSQR